MPSAFLDTNILVYAAAGDRDDPVKAEIARQLMAHGDFGISFQVLQEFYVTCRRIDALTAQELDAWIRNLLQFECADGTPELFMEAVRLARRYHISYWDAAIVAAAAQLGATMLYTEDLSHRQTYGTVAAINPFVDHQ